MLAMLLLNSCVSVPRPEAESKHFNNGIHYDQVGHGNWIVLIHGTNMDSRLWESEREWMALNHRVLTYDLRGQGQSDFPEEEYSNHLDLLNLLHAVKAQHVVLVGLSAGAQVALDVALIEPALVDRIVLVSPSIRGFVPEVIPDFLTDLMSALKDRDFDLANEVLISSPMMEVPPDRRTVVKEMVETNAKLWEIPYSIVIQNNPLAIQRLDEISMPTLILLGAKDVGTTIEQGEHLERELVNARLVKIPEGGHLLNMTSPVLFQQAFLEFISEEL